VRFDRIYFHQPQPVTPLYQRAQHRWRADCPCCGVRMTDRRVKQGRPVPLQQLSRGHDAPVGRGGANDVWLYICHGCNNEQGVLDFAQWARKLLLAEDPRAERVVEVAKFVRAWVAERDEKRRQNT